MYSENYIDERNWRWQKQLERYIMFMKELILLKCSYRQGSLHIQGNSIQIPVSYFTELEQIILKFVWKYRRPVTLNFKKLKQSWGSRKLVVSHALISDYTIKLQILMWYGHKIRHTDQWDRIELRNKPKFIWSINLWQVSQEYTYSGGKNSLFKKWCWEN